MGEFFSGTGVGARQAGSSAMACFCLDWAESTTQDSKRSFLKKRTKKLLLNKALRCFSTGAK
jgi:hypothetical protein